MRIRVCIYADADADGDGSGDDGDDMTIIKLITIIIKTSKSTFISPN